MLDDALLVASLVALTRAPVAPGGARWGSFGRDLRALRATRSGAAERLMRAILGSERADLPVHLRRAVSLLGSDEKPLDVRALVRDLGGWEREGQPVQKRWAYDFWAEIDRAARNRDSSEDDR